jgi:glyoxylase-like metal-dependent hydrolase (beta-lactamase superfamily II)
MSFEVDGIRLTRVPYFDVSLGASVIGLTRDQVASVPWAIPSWATPTGEVLVGQAIWVIESDDQVLIADPCGAADAFIRSGPEAVTHQQAVVEALAASGYSVEVVDLVVLSHLDGIGMTAAVDIDGRWSPFFPNARIVLSDSELAHIEANPNIGGASALSELMGKGVVDGLSPPSAIAPGVNVEQSGGHSPGHLIMRIGEGAVFIGHLAVSPLQAAAGVQPGQHVDANRAHDVLVDELRWACDRHALMLGPLWPDPGAGRISGPPWVVTAA